jgi:hypothetical protein
MTENIFEKLLAIDVSSHVEKKGKFNYLSWPWAVAELRKVDPKASWRIIHFYGGEDKGIVASANQPYMKTDCGYFVEVEVTVDDVKLSQIHPVLDHRNKPIPEPTAFDINTSIQRCLVKAIALHGLGLSLYAGEDLPPNKPEEPKKPSPKQTKEKPVTFDELSEKISTAKTVPLLTDLYNKHVGSFEGEELANLMFQLGARKEEIRGA